MINVVNVNTSAFISRRNTSSLLIVLLIFLYSSVVPRLQRQLVESESNEVNPFKNISRGNKNEEEIPVKPVKKLSVENTGKDINTDLKKKTTLNKSHTPQTARLNKKDAFIGSYHHFKDTKKVYYKMMEYLKKWFYKRTLHYKIPHDMMYNLWQGYKMGLMDDLNEMEEYCVESIYEFAENGTVEGISRTEYDEFVNNLRKICKRFSRISERKWKTLMNEKLKILKKAVSAYRKQKDNNQYYDVVEQFYLHELMSQSQDEKTEGGGEEVEDEDSLIKKKEAVLKQMEELEELFDEEGELIDEEGELIDEEGELIDEEGELIDEEGELIEDVGEQLRAEWEQIETEDQMETEEHIETEEPKKAERKKNEKEAKSGGKEKKSSVKEKKPNVKESKPSVKESKPNVKESKPNVKESKSNVKEKKSSIKETKQDGKQIEGKPNPKESKAKQAKLTKTKPTKEKLSA
ncbi:RAD protein [Plasmodium cynomolgi strain B]|uniref:RAD protein n=1 Tax=Plasmodium cynomolgi (strain B) TaxID=1120755 RepID=K6UCP4_PLACD|nr:RAD protein [Plasmodium cynomolgi strain B]GAB65206.1 RAD protein [Plasmodium cynomolgi strain B]